jgi:hypothetical protein
MLDWSYFDNSKVIMLDDWKEHVAKMAHSRIVEPNQMNCQNKNCQTSKRSP